MLANAAEAQSCSPLVKSNLKQESRPIMRYGHFSSPNFRFHYIPLLQILLVHELSRKRLDPRFQVCDVISNRDIHINLCRAGKVSDIPGRLSKLVNIG